MSRDYIFIRIFCRFPLTTATIAISSELVVNYMKLQIVSVSLTVGMENKGIGKDFLVPKLIYKTINENPYVNSMNDEKNTRSIYVQVSFLLRKLT